MHLGPEHVTGLYTAGEPNLVKRTQHAGSHLLSCYGRRLAVVDVDWARIRAVDVYAVLSSFAANLGVVEDVTLYLSQYGDQSIEQESLHHAGSPWQASQVLITTVCDNFALCMLA